MTWQEGVWQNEEGKNGVANGGGAKWRREDAIETARRDRAQTARWGAGSGGGGGGTESVAIMTENCALPGSAAQHRHLIQFNCDTVQ